MPAGPSTGTSLGLESQQLQSDLPSVRPVAGDSVREVRPVGVERPLLKGLQHEHRLPCMETVHGNSHKDSKLLARVSSGHPTAPGEAPDAAVHPPATGLTASRK